MLFANVGARLAPLSSLDEIAGFFLAASSNAPHAPSRASIIAQWLGASLTDAAFMLLPMLKTLSSMPRVQKILALLPPVENMSIGTDRTTCVVCEGALEPAEHCTTAPLISARGSEAASRPYGSSRGSARAADLRCRPPYVVRNRWLTFRIWRALPCELCRV